MFEPVGNNVGRSTCGFTGQLFSQWTSRRNEWTMGVCTRDAMLTNMSVWLSVTRSPRFTFITFSSGWNISVVSGKVKFLNSFLNAPQRQSIGCEGRVLLQKRGGLGLQPVLLHARSKRAFSNNLHPPGLWRRHWAAETALFARHWRAQILSRWTGHAWFRPEQLPQRYRAVNWRFWRLDLSVRCLLAGVRGWSAQWQGDAGFHLFLVVFIGTRTSTWSACAWRHNG